MCTAEDGTIFIKKLGKRYYLLESEARMLGYATHTMHIKGPKLRAVYLEGDMRVMETDFDPGVTIHSVWCKLSPCNKKAIMQQLRTEILKMRESTRPLIGRIEWDGSIAKNDPYYDPYYLDTMSHNVTFFGSESEFDNHKIEQMRARRGDSAASALAKRIESLRKQYTERFVLTHADLQPENIHVCRTTDPKKRQTTWQLSGILDWGRSGFYPEYMEYATAMKIGPYPPYWQKVMKTVLKGLECSKERLVVEDMATDCL
jgi:Phosphotransferase enzyme family